MAINQPYYAQHQILTGQYTPGEELVLANGSNYVGGYHILPNGHYFTGFNPSEKSVELFEKRNDWSADVTTYNRIKQIVTMNYVQPTPYLSIPTLDDYNDGYLYRYFVQKRNNPLVTIMEIDVNQFNAINTKNQPGLNGTIWNSAVIKWKLTGSNILEFNLRELEQAEILYKFRGLRAILTNLKEYSK